MCGPMKIAPPPGPVSFMSYLRLGQRVVRDGGQPVGEAVGAAEDAEHARHRLGARRIDAEDARVRMGRAHHRRVGLAVEVEIVAEAAAAGDEPLVLLAHDAACR